MGFVYSGVLFAATHITDSYNNACVKQSQLSIMQSVPLGNISNTNCMQSQSVVCQMENNGFILGNLTFSQL